MDLKMVHLSLNQLAYQTIKSQILNIQIKGGEQIREDLLAKELGISRTPVREAINRLTTEGLIISIPRKGLYCVEITEDMVRNILDLRDMFESYAACRFSELCTPKQIEHLRKIQRTISDAKRNVSMIVDGERDFHGYMIEVLQNSLMTQQYHWVADLMYLTRRILIPQQSIEEWKKADSVHDMLIDACEVHDSHKASEIARQSVHLAKEQFERLCREEGWHPYTE